MHNSAMALLQRLWIWIKNLRTPLMWTVAGLVLSFVFLGWPGFASYWPAEQLFRWSGDAALLKRIQSDHLWPVLISASFLQALLITPAHCLVRRWWPQASRFGHVLRVLLLVWLVSVVATSLMLLAQVDA